MTMNARAPSTDSGLTFQMKAARRSGGVLLMQLNDGGVRTSTGAEGGRGGPSPYSSSSFILFFAAFASLPLPFVDSCSSTSAPTFFNSNWGFSAKCTPT